MGCGSGGGGGSGSGMLGSELLSDLISPDNKPADGKAPGVETLLVLWIIGWITLPFVVFMGLYIKSHLLPIIMFGFIGLGLWACGHYGTNRSVVARFRYRYSKRQHRCTERQRLIIARRLSGKSL